MTDSKHHLALLERISSDAQTVGLALGEAFAQLDHAAKHRDPRECAAIEAERDRALNEARELRLLNSRLTDHTICRLQLPDGTVPGNTAEALECWYRVAQDLNSRIAELRREFAEPRPDFFAQLQDANRTRAARWHPGGLGDWSILEWAGCMAGEAGEAANVAKKMRREQTGAEGRNHPSDLRAALAKELADTIIYADLVAAKAGIDLREAIATTFNLKSVEYGFPERIEARRF